MRDKNMCRRVLPLVCAVALFSNACHAKPEENQPVGKFLVTSPLRTDTALTKSYVAQIRAIQHIEVRALERGYLQDVYVDEGQLVKKDQKLFQISPVIYEAELQKAAASAQLADIEYSNTKSLADKNVVSNKELAMAKARVNEAKAEVNLAATRKGMTEFKASFDGLVGRFSVRKGSLVDKGDLMTTLSDNSTLWVYFNVSESEYLEYKKKSTEEKSAAVRLMMANGQVYDLSGHVETIESDFNNDTGNIAFRAIFANPSGLLRHGETGKILMNVPYKGALLIPQEATFDVLEKKYVFKVDEKNRVHAQVITVAAEMPQVYVVSGGLTEHDKILVEGLRKVSDGSFIQSDYKAPEGVIKTLEVPAE
jgi:membrane fusion protein (multidrug efflux system)